MPENNPPAFYQFIHYHFIGFIYLIYIHIKIVIDNISSCSYQYRSNYQENKLMMFKGGYNVSTIYFLINTIFKKQLCKCNKDKIGPANQSEKSSYYFQNSYLNKMKMQKEKVNNQYYRARTESSSPQLP